MYNAGLRVYMLDNYNWIVRPRYVATTSVAIGRIWLCLQLQLDRLHRPVRLPVVVRPPYPRPAAHPLRRPLLQRSTFSTSFARWQLRCGLSLPVRRNIGPGLGLDVEVPVCISVSPSRRNVSARSQCQSVGLNCDMKAANISVSAGLGLERSISFKISASPKYQCTSNLFISPTATITGRRGRARPCFSTMSRCTTASATRSSATDNSLHTATS